MTHPTNEQPKLDLEALKAVVAERRASAETAVRRGWSKTVEDHLDFATVTISFNDLAALIARVQEGEDPRRHPSRPLIEAAVINSPALQDTPLDYRKAVASDVATDVIVDALSPSTPKAGDEGSKHADDRFVDDFNGDNVRLLDSTAALLRMHSAGALSHPIPGLARQLLSNLAARLSTLTAGASKADGDAR